MKKYVLVEVIRESLGSIWNSTLPVLIFDTMEDAKNYLKENGWTIREEHNYINYSIVTNEKFIETDDEYITLTKYYGVVEVKHIK